ncbi:hypothetical protein [Hymenobacter sp. CRA2]|uniref:hypothetical protein n=1 Tax=Hymenobacter sp. CRA2 TaxID=1955620 RepID=UPI00098FD199|nr:hypothetical protein [Hymenobacter sp. CRA2]OON68277.1 hypothetical protein B0919_14080 [Hymenobacter sp. CRA2]
MLLRYALLLTFSVLTLASCQSARPTLSASGWALTGAATDSTVVLMHSSQGPEPVRATVSMTEARSMSAERAGAGRR